MSIRNELRQPGNGKKITGHDIDALERFGEDTRHMIVFDVITWDCPVGDKGERVRIFLTDEGYKKALESEVRGEMKIVRHARVRKHADAIQQYEAAQKHFAAVMNGRTQLPVKDWQKEQKELLAKRYVMCDEYYSLKEEITSVEAIRRSVENLISDITPEWTATRVRNVEIG